MGILLRAFLVVLGLAVLAACEPEPMVEATAGQALVVRNIVVDTTGITGVEGRDIIVTPAQVRKDIAAALQAALKRPGAGNADVHVRVTKVQLIARGASVAFLQSNVQAVLTVTDAKTGAEIIPPTAITGNSEQLRLGGVVGVLTAPGADADYRQTINGFAASVRARLYGSDAPVQ